MPHCTILRSSKCLPYSPCCCYEGRAVGGRPTNTDFPGLNPPSLPQGKWLGYGQWIPRHWNPSLSHWSWSPTNTGPVDVHELEPPSKVDCKATCFSQAPCSPQALNPDSHCKIFWTGALGFLSKVLLLHTHISHTHTIYTDTHHVHTHTTHISCTHTCTHYVWMYNSSGSNYWFVGHRTLSPWPKVLMAW